MMYLLYHNRWVDDNYYDTKVIGIYSSHEKALNTIENYLSLSGFSEFPTGFCIDSFNIAHRKKNVVYLVSGVCPVDFDEVTVSFGIYPNKIVAVVVSMIRTIRRNKKLGKKFYVDRYLIDEDNWKEGFVIMEG